MSGITGWGGAKGGLTKKHEGFLSVIFASVTEYYRLDGLNSKQIFYLFYFFYLEDGKFEFVVQHGQVLVRALSLACRQYLLTVSSQRGERSPLVSLLIGALILFNASLLQPNCFPQSPLPSTMKTRMRGWAYEFCGGHKHSVHSSSFGMKHVFIIFILVVIPVVCSYLKTEANCSL